MKLLKSSLFLAALLGAFVGMAIGSGPIMGTASVEVTQSSFQFVAMPESIAAGRPFAIVVQAVDQNGAVIPTFRDKVEVTSSDDTATLPADYTYTVRDAGQHRFTFTLRGDGEQTITVTDMAGQTITGTTTTAVGG